MNETGIVMTPEPREGFRRIAYTNRKTIADSVYDFNNGIEIKVGYFHRWVMDQGGARGGIRALIETTNNVMETAHYECLQFLDK